MPLPKPPDWFIGAVEFFGVLVPGGIAVFVSYFVATNAGWVPAQLPMSGTPAWVAFLVAALIVGYLAHPPAHVFNRAYDRWYASPRRKGGDPDKEFVEQNARGRRGSTDSLYAWAKSELADRGREQLTRVELMEGVSKMFRTLTLLAIVAAAVCFAGRA